jgi:ComF family protein
MIHSIFKTILPAFYPELCLLCRTEHRLRDEEFCLSCLLELPYTDHFVNPENGFMRHFWGRVSVEMGAALIDFQKGNEIRQLIHRFKYQKEIEIGHKLGEITGRKYLDSLYFGDADLIIPVPTTLLKRWKRGFNQAEIFAKGIAAVTQLPLDVHILKKIKNTKTQTKKNRVERLADVMGTFQVDNPNAVNDKHILLVDDILTTGATLEACIHAFKGCPGVKISLLTIGMAKG